MLRIPSKILKATVSRNIDNFINESGLSNENQWVFIKKEIDGRTADALDREMENCPR